MSLTPRDSFKHAVSETLRTHENIRKNAEALKIFETQINQDLKNAGLDHISVTIRTDLINGFAEMTTHYDREKVKDWSGSLQRQDIDAPNGDLLVARLLPASMREQDVQQLDAYYKSQPAIPTPDINT